ncbi:MAG: chemotaxis protein CheW [Rhodospirillales bacterium]|jgi:two-component system chemotaxis sensor kinase CheA|nr:chemotaxis protein CheW [Rhodospirillales bacterium]MDP7216393.1 chemotaxis protein CheW [Rhodospirillales bacterium]HIJ92526.1 response regulator [Rhodospirillaceae bacterium]HJP54326.1 chemotaxis protein CheW [Rhodospirillales bacterium]
MDDLLNEFITETTENLAAVDVELVKFEQEPQNAEILQNIFRMVHTVKGTCGFLDLPRLEAVAHAGENVLGKFRDKELAVTPVAVTLILKCIDRIRELMTGLEETGEEPEGDDCQLIDELNALAGGRGAAPEPAIGEAGIFEAAEPLADVETVNAAGTRTATADEMLAGMAAERASKQDQAKPAIPALAAAGGKVPAAPEKEASVAAQSIRVNVNLLEALMALISELVLTRNQLLQMVRGYLDSEFQVPLQRLSHITSDLQEGVMKTRMQPIGNAWAQLPRVIRDLAVESGKKIELQMFGAETELDRQVLELIKDPLTHMVRNSSDHGIETPQERKQAGKPETGTLTLNAFHAGGHVIIEIADDGKGLDIERISNKIIANGLASEAEVEMMSDQQIAQYIFKPGFSTAEKVTGVSGRGVGMDVVCTNIEKISGTVELKTIAGKGATFTIKIPLTLAIVSTLIVESSGQRFAIPLISVLELVRTSSLSKNTIEMINESPVLRLRDRLLPLVSLNGLLNLGGKNMEIVDELFIVVIQVGTFTFGIIVDRVFDTEEIVIKPVAPILRNIPFFSGNTILGDGSVIMVLDPNGIAVAAGQTGVSDAKAVEATTAAVGRKEEKSSMLVFRAGGAELKAVLLDLVARLEEIDMATVETSHGQQMIQYRGLLMPLIPFDPDHHWKAEGRQPILVFTDRQRSMGLVVDEIVDIVEDILNIEISTNQPGLIGSAVINGKATDIIDAGYFLTQAFFDWFGSSREDYVDGGDVAKKVLLVDDSPFFRNLLTPMLSVAGYLVVPVASAIEALEMREKGEQFDIIVSDIEMPGMDGFEFAEHVRGDPRWESVPFVALSLHVSDKNFERGREVGFTGYVAKFDRQALIATLAATVSMAAEGGGAA